MRAGVPLAWKRKAEARLKLRDSTAAQEVLDCANATPFRTAAYQTALACATQYELCKYCSAKCTNIAVEVPSGTHPSWQLPYSIDLVEVVCSQHQICWSG